jgi:hypothetical protein
MATPERVDELFHRRIGNDSRDQLEKAGEVWRDLPMNFFYLTHAADTVDIVVTSIAGQLAEEDGVSIPDMVMENLQSLVNPKTLVKEAMRLVFLTIFRPL